jgi:hypothetical protein
MSFERRRLIIGAALLLTSGCVETVDDVGELDAVFREYLPDLPGPVVDEICPGWRQVAISNTGDCPIINGWKESHLFGTTVGDEYQKYCMYDWKTGPLLQINIDEVQDHASFDEVATECVSVRMQGQLVTTLNPELRELTQDRIDTVTDAEIGLPDPEHAATRQKVGITVFDTIPTVRPANPRSSHGIQVADLIKDIARGCTNWATCNVVVQTSLGLPRTGPRKADIDTTRGGYAAMPSDLVIGIHNQIMAWENLPNPKPKLILNLSIGWLRAFGGEVAAGDIPNAPPSIKALRIALERARCRGVLILAAAGNSHNDCETDPVMPGEWERLPAPDQDRCEDVLEVQLADLGGSDYHPLVYSVGGLDLNDKPIVVTRPGGRPRLAAFGENVVGPDLTYGAASGTSMAVAAVTGMAGLVWSFKGTWGPDDVMDEIYESGVGFVEDGVPAQADYGAEDAIFPIHKVTACGALQSACQGIFNCPAWVNVDCVDSPKPLDELATVVNALAGDVAPVSLPVESIGSCDYYCGATQDSYAVAGAGCPVLEDDDQQTNFIAWPQPDDLGCATCTWETTAASTDEPVTTIWASLTRAYQFQSVENASVTLVLDDGSSGGTPRTYPLGNIDLAYGTITPLEIENGPTEPILSGTITLTFGGQKPAVTTDVLVPGTSNP